VLLEEEEEEFFSFHIFVNSQIWLNQLMTNYYITKLKAKKKEH